MCAKELHLPSWASVGAKCTWLSQSSGKPQAVRITVVDPEGKALTVSFDRDPKAFKVVPFSQLGRGSRLRPIVKDAPGAAAAPRSNAPHRPPLEEAAWQLKADAEMRRRELEAKTQAEKAAKKEQLDRETAERMREEERRRREREQELAAEFAERERERKVQELRKWREDEARREIQEAENAKHREIEGRKRKQRLKREREQQQEEEAAWERLKQEAMQAAKQRKTGPAWAVLGAKCMWASSSLKKLMPVTVTAVDSETGAVTVTFDADPQAFKVVTLEQLNAEDCPLQPKR
mmetsp:Transcript_72916/g.144497  ORF Transcript_72916/g.144497 Transcript_72916/m.144497 type:complete len:292 (-) Transcript_72916:73-948(-)